MSLDLSKLDVGAESPDCIISRCPACAEDDRDSRGEHLIIYPEGQFACAAFQGDAGEEHRKRIWELAGLRTPSSRPPRRRILEPLTGRRVPGPDPRGEDTLDALQWRMEAGRKTAAEWASILPRIVEDFRWTPQQANAESAPIPKSPLQQFRLFPRLFRPDDVIFFGHRYAKGRQFFRSARAWAELAELPYDSNDYAPDGELSYDHASLWTYRPGSNSKAESSRLTLRYRTLEIDGAPLEVQMAVINFARRALGLWIAFIVHSGRSSLHAIVDRRSLRGREQKIERALTGYLLTGGLGGDGQSWLLGTTRTPGVRRNIDDKTSARRQQSVLWINPAWLAASQ